MKKTFLLIIFAFLGLSSFSQKKVLIEDKDTIIARANAEMDQAMLAPDGEIYNYTLKNPIKGEYIFDISINDKSGISSIFVVGSKDGTIDAQNRFKAFLMTYKFHFKVPKGKSYKFRHSFVFE